MDAIGSRSGGYPRPLDIWLYTVNAAQSEKEVVAAARDYIATWTPLEISRLPADCRPERILDAESISDYAYRLSRAHLEFQGALTDRLLLERLMGFFGHAAARISSLTASSPSVSPVPGDA